MKKYIMKRTENSFHSKKGSAYLSFVLDQFGNTIYAKKQRLKNNVIKLS